MTERSIDAELRNLFESEPGGTVAD